MTVIGSVRFVELFLNVYLFKGADKYEYLSETELTRQRQRESSGALAMVLVGFPLYLYHWKTIQKEANKKILNP